VDEPTSKQLGGLGEVCVIGAWCGDVGHQSVSDEDTSYWSVGSVSTASTRRALLESSSRPIAACIGSVRDLDSARASAAVHIVYSLFLLISVLFIVYFCMYVFFLFMLPFW